MTNDNNRPSYLAIHQKIWLVTGVAGFIGSNILESLLGLNQIVVGLDNLSTGYEANLDEVRSKVTLEQWRNFQFRRGDIRNIEDCRDAMQFVRGESPYYEKLSVNCVLHQAALGSVPRSLQDPIATNSCNVDGFLNMLVSARDAKVDRFVYAASSSTYGDHPGLPKVEDKIGKPLSPYAVSKLVNELYADTFSRCYGIKTIGLRYFNVFGPRQDPNGSYAAVIPKWISAILRGDTVFINGDGETSRDFCYVDNVVQANLLAATTDNPDAINQIFNVAVGERTTLNDLVTYILDELTAITPIPSPQVRFRDFLTGDVRHSLADIGKAQSLLGYTPTVRVAAGLHISMPWYIKRK